MSVFDNGMMMSRTIWASLRARVPRSGDQTTVDFRH